MSEHPHDQAGLPHDAHAVPEALPILPLRGCVAYPGLMVPLVVGRPASIAMVEAASEADGWLGLAALRDAEQEDPRFADLFPIGAVGRIQRLWRNPEGAIQMLVQVTERVRLTEPVQELPHIVARVTPFREDEVEGLAGKAMLRRAMHLFQELVELAPHLSGELAAAVMTVDESREVIYLIASALNLPLAWRQDLLAAPHMEDKLEMVLAALAKELELTRLGSSLQAKVTERLNQQNKEYFLREQMRMIQEELEEPEEDDAITQLKARIAAGALPSEAEAEAKRELKRLAQVPPGSPEHGMIHHYLEWLGRVPWGVVTGHAPEVASAREMLDNDHEGLEKVKERLLEYLAVRQLRASRGLPTDDSRVHEPILCLVGPPGVGKTSLGRSIARALGRHFVRVSLGGVHDEAAIRGHRRTYIGAMPGRIVQALARAGAADPVIMLDELDKVGADYRGDPASALLELLDPEQNAGFRDHFLDVPLDLSRAVFIATANTLDTIHPALRDRLEIVQLAGYTEDEKVAIARRFLLPRQLTAHGLGAGELTVTEEALRQVIRGYTREAGVRTLERQLAALCRKAAMENAMENTLENTLESSQKGAQKRSQKGARPRPAKPGAPNTPATGAETLAARALEAPSPREKAPPAAPRPLRYGPADLEKRLGVPRLAPEASERIDRPGVATGLVWTPVGGDILFIEATAMPGKKVLKLTGQLGEVMRESAEAALSYLRSRATQLGLDPSFFETTDLHLHVPGGAIPKDGPSAGITLSVALLSALTGRPVRDDLAMTGEITLRGKVLPVGGIKEKVLGARRAGLHTVLLPKRNMPDLDELPPELLNDMKFIPVDSVDEVWEAAFETAPKPRRKGKRSAVDPSLPLVVNWIEGPPHAQRSPIDADQP